VKVLWILKFLMEFIFII